MKQRKSCVPLAGTGRESGSLSLMLIVMFAALVALAGLVIDGGAKLNQDETAYSIAQEAARAGAGTVNRSAAYTSGTFVVSQQQAITAARAYLVSAGYRGAVAAAGTKSITVTVTITRPTSVLSIIGIDSMTTQGTAVASLVSGVVGPGA